MQQSQQLPTSLTVNISRYGLSIGDGFDVQAGTTLMVECFPASYFPQALKFYGCVQEVNDGELVVVFHELGEHVEDLLDKFIFRWHRRSVALRREHKVSDSTD